jgi:hypothetical protein
MSTTVARAFAARSTVFSVLLSSLKQCSKDIEWCEFIIATHVLCGEAVRQQGCVGPLHQLAPGLRTDARTRAAARDDAGAIRIRFAGSGEYRRPGYFGR